MTLARFSAQNHPQQVARRGASGDVDDRETAPEFFGPLHERFAFTLDVAAATHNAKLPRYFTPEDDGLASSWAGERVWCNPPYSACGAWVAKAWQEWPGAELVVMLLPNNRTEQGWWQRLVEPFRDRQSSPLRVEFLPGRMRFIRPGVVPDPRGDRPPFGNCLLVWEHTRPVPASGP